MPDDYEGDFSSSSQDQDLPEIPELPEEVPKEDTACAICLEDFEGLASKTPCGHYFHQNEIEEWFIHSRKCPLCREKCF